MKANELRIGNIVGQLGRVATITSINAKTANLKAEFSRIKCSYDLIEPIPLTEEWLLKFGFEEIENDTYINGHQYQLQVTGERADSGKINRDETWFDGIGDSSWINAGGRKTVVVNVLCRGNYVCKDASEVHELQNLYFALTGEELTLK